MKKLICIVMILVLAVSSLSVASAGSFFNRNAVKKTAVTLGVAGINAAVSALVKIGQATPYNDAKLVKATTDVLCETTKALAEKTGVELACEYDTYEIDGQQVEIDPLRVINIH